MRFLLLILGVLLSSLCFSQDCYPNMELKALNHKTASILSSKFDSTSTLIVWGYNNYWAKGEVLTLFETNKHCKIKKFEVFIPFNKASKISIKRKRLKREMRNNAKNSISELLASKKYLLNENLLNIRSYEVETNGQSISMSMVISDGSSICFYIIKASKSIYYHSFEPKTFIQKKVYGFQERQKLLDILEILNSIST